MAVFDGQKAYEYAGEQVAMGPRVPGSAAHDEFIGWATRKLIHYDWSVYSQEGVMLGYKLTNIVAKKGSGDRVLILSAHYDSRIVADEDKRYPERREPVPGANDGASGVAVLLELARVLEIPAGKQVWIVMFDREDNGRLPGNDWILGSRYFAGQLDNYPYAVVNLDMIGDADLGILKETSSTPWLYAELLEAAKSQGYGQYFLDDERGILDDHTPFLEKGISAVDLIDFDYPYWHTLEDTMDKLSSESLAVVGRTVEKWVEEY